MMRLQGPTAVFAGIVGGHVDLDQPFSEAGLDSIGSVEFCNAASALAGKDLPATIAFDYPTVSVMAEYIRSQMAPPASLIPQIKPRTAAAMAADVQSLARTKQVDCFKGSKVTKHKI